MAANPHKTSRKTPGKSDESQAGPANTKTRRGPRASKPATAKKAAKELSGKATRTSAAKRAAPNRKGSNSSSDGFGAVESLSPRTPEQLLALATTGRGMSPGSRPARGHGYDLRGLSYVPVSRLHEGRFGRMFRLAPFVPNDDQIAAIAALMLDDAGADPDNDNPNIPAGYTYLGQFIDHDLTLDTASSLDRTNDPDALTNFRSPRFDLDSIYGRGPVDDPYLYDRTTGGEKLLIGTRTDDPIDPRDDLQRNRQEVALIGDPRNDENTFVGQLHLTMLKFHNAVVDLVTGDATLKLGSETVFEASQRIVRWHYQWLVVHDFLRRTVSGATFGAVFDETGPLPKVNRDFYKWTSDPYMPVEFSVAAYRFGHSQVRGRYTLNTLVQRLPTFLPTSTQDPATRLQHFGGFRELPPFWTIEWPRFFEVDGPGSDQLQVTRRIDTKLANPLAKLPPEIGGSRPSLIDRNLTRGARLLLPSGQDVACHMGIDVLTDEELALPDGGAAPLWYYVLKEAEVRAAGEHLGEVGGRIVAEVFMGLMEKDPSSYLRNQPTWTPFLPSKTSGDFTMPDLIAFTGHGLDVITPPGPLPPNP